MYHSNDPSTHSTKVPSKSNSKTINNKIENIIKFIKPHANGIGTNKVISTSKIKKINAIKKKCIEKGRRADDFKSNPHSNVEFFSRMSLFIDEIKKFNRIKNEDKLPIVNSIIRII